MEEDLYLSNLSESERDEAYKKYQALWPFLESRMSLRKVSEQSVRAKWYPPYHLTREDSIHSVAIYWILSIRFHFAA